MTDKITLELTLDELKTLDKHIEYNEETKSVFDKIKYAYPQLKMTLTQSGEYAVVSYNDTTYYRLMGEDSCFCWWIKKGVSANYHTPTLVMVTDAETERLLDGLYYNDIVVKKEKEQQTKSPVEEAYKDAYGKYPETGTTASNTDVARWQGFQAGYEVAYAISTAKEVLEEVQKEPKDNEWKSVALRFGEKLVSVSPCGYYEFSAEEWYDWVVNTYEKLADDWLSLLKKEKVKKSKINDLAEKLLPDDHPYKIADEHEETNPLNSVDDEKKMEELGFVKSSDGNWTAQPLDWVKPQTPEQVADGLKEAFRKAVKQGVIPPVEKKQKTLTDLIERWWSDVFTTHSDWDMETSIDDLVDRIQLWLPKEQSAKGSQNAYVECSVDGFNDCVNKIKGNLR